MLYTHVKRTRESFIVIASYQPCVKCTYTDCLIHSRPVSCQPGRLKTGDLRDMTGEVTCPDYTASTARLQVTEVCKCVKRFEKYVPRLQ